MLCVAGELNVFSVLHIHICVYIYIYSHTYTCIQICIFFMCSSLQCVHRNPLLYLGLWWLPFLHGMIIFVYSNMSLGELRELVMDREAWLAAIHGVAKSWTRLSDWTELNLLFYPFPVAFSLIIRRLFSRLPSLHVSQWINCCVFINSSINDI